jgi:ubiquitin-like protein Pup
MAQERKVKSKARSEENHTEDTHSGVSNSEVSESASATVAAIDDVLEDQLDEELLADIDDVLETNAQEFVENYVQEGGE